MRKNKTIIIIILGIFTWIMFYVISSKKNKDEVYTLHDKTKKLDPYFNDDYYAKKCQEGKVMDIYLDMNIKGQVIGKYYKVMAHNEPLIWVEDVNYYYDIRSRDFDENGIEFFNEIKVGDSIFKKSGSLIFSIKRDTLIRNINATFIENRCVNPYYIANTDKLK